MSGSGRDFMPDANRPPSPQAVADLKALARDNAINAELIKSLTASKEEARAHIRFFKRMMFVSNGAVMTIGLALAGYGGKKLVGGFSIVAVVCLLAGLLLFVKFTAVFAGMTRSIRKTEAVARKHELI